MTDLHSLVAERILVLDGAMGTMLMARGFGGSLDHLVLTDPGAVGRIHHAYLGAGSDIIRTNTFTNTEYGLNLAAARLARDACDEWSSRGPDKPRFVAGSIGPVGTRENYQAQVRGLVDGGCDLLLVETVLGSAALAALAAIDDIARAGARRLPVMISAAISASTGRLFSGESIEEFWRAAADVRPWSIGLNCSSGARNLAPHLRALARIANCLISFHPSAGLPDAGNNYPERPQDLADVITDLCSGDPINIVGGCCGTTPDHVTAVAKAVAGGRPRRV